jgi:hypothetical protein
MFAVSLVNFSIFTATETVEQADLFRRQIQSQKDLRRRTAGKDFSKMRDENGGLFFNAFGINGAAKAVFKAAF